MDGGMGSSCPDSQGQGLNNRGMSGPNTPLTPSSNANDLPPRYPGNNNNGGGGGNNNAGGPQTPHTPNPTNPFTVPSPSPAGSSGGQCQQQQQQSSNQNMGGPHTPLASMEKARYPGPSPGQQQQGPRTPVSSSMDGSGGMPRTPGSMGMNDMMGGGGGGSGGRYPSSSPQMSGPSSVGAPGGFNPNQGSMMTSQGPASYPSGPGMKMPSSPFPDLSSPRMVGGDMSGGGGYPGGPSDMVPGGVPSGMVPTGGGPKPFDPISSMAQMSQQLTSQGPGGPPGMSSSPPPGSMMGMGGPNGPGMMGMGPGGMQMQFNPSMHGMPGMPSQQQMGDPNAMMMGPGNGGPPMV